MTETPSSSSNQTIDFAQPFRFVFDDPDWVRKIAVGGLFYLLMFVFVGIFFVAGYAVRLGRNVIRGDARPLPEWDDLGEYFADGVKVFVITMVYALPLFVIWGFAMGGMALSGAFENEEAGALVAAFSGCWMLIMSLFALVYSIMLPSVLITFVGTGSMAEAFNVRRVMRFVVENPANYALAWLIYLVANFVGQAGFVLLCIGIVFTAFWSVVASTYAFADAWRLARVR